MPLPGIGGVDGVHDQCFQDLGKRTSPDMQQRQREPVDPDVVILIVCAGLESRRSSSSVWRAA